MTVMEIEILESLDFEPDDTCTNPRKECDNPAMWACITICCDISFPVCNACKVRWDELIEKYTAAGSYLITCDLCGTTSYDEDLMRFELL